jgi:SAM-dependent methyltransferase
MALTGRLGIVVDCYPDKSIIPYARDLFSDDEAVVDAASKKLSAYADRYANDSLKRLSAANNQLFRIIKDKEKVLSNMQRKRMLDIGAGGEGSFFVNRYVQEFGGTEVVYLDNCRELLTELEKSGRVLADAQETPFADDSFDIGCAFGIIAGHIRPSEEPYAIVKEARRIIRPGGFLIFDHSPSENDPKTRSSLNELGFKEIEHLQRVLWLYGTPKDIYAAR